MLTIGKMSFDLLIWKNIEKITCNFYKSVLSLFI